MSSTMADIAAKYAQAIHEAHKNGGRGLVTRAREALLARGHGKLIPRIAKELEKLELKEARREMHERVTPESERMRVLIQLYRKLTN